MFDIQTVEDNLSKARADVEFWESAKRILTDPRIALVSHKAPLIVVPQSTQYVLRPYGTVKAAVYMALPEFGEEAKTSTDLVGMLRKNGHPLGAKQPGVTVNDALVALEAEKKAINVGRSGASKLWTKVSKRDDQGQEKEVTEATS
jgi:hypothetical protein